MSDFMVKNVVATLVDFSQNRKADDIGIGRFVGIIDKQIKAMQWQGLSSAKLVRDLSLKINADLVDLKINDLAISASECEVALNSVGLSEDGFSYMITALANLSFDINKESQFSVFLDDLYNAAPMALMSLGDSFNSKVAMDVASVSKGIISFRKSAHILINNFDVSFFQTLDSTTSSGTVYGDEKFLFLVSQLSGEKIIVPEPGDGVDYKLAKDYTGLPLLALMDMPLITSEGIGALGRALSDISAEFSQRPVSDFVGSDGGEIDFAQVERLKREMAGVVENYAKLSSGQFFGRYPGYGSFDIEKENFLANLRKNQKIVVLYPAGTTVCSSLAGGSELEFDTQASIRRADRVHVFDNISLALSCVNQSVGLSAVALMASPQQIREMSNSAASYCRTEGDFLIRECVSEFCAKQDIQGDYFDPAVFAKDLAISLAEKVVYLGDAEGAILGELTEGRDIDPQSLSYVIGRTRDIVVYNMQKKLNDDAIRDVLESEVPSDNSEHSMKMSMR
jgi:hypothetical protein